MHRKLIFNLILLITISFCLKAQDKFSIQGTVSDDKGILPGANIYISGYKMMAVADGFGKFILPNLGPGDYDILVKMIGYQSYKKRINISEQSVDIKVILKEDATALNEIVVKPDPNRPEYLQLFKDAFIGKTPNAQQCRILNTNEIQFNYDKKEDILTAKTSKFLIIENKALGYQIKYLLENFIYNNKSQIFYYEGQPFFEDLIGNAAMQSKWVKARKIAYNGSRQHFFKALYDNRVKEEGYIINRMFKTPNPNKQPDEVVEANIQRLLAERKNAGLKTKPGIDSLSYWLKQREEMEYVNNFITDKINIDSLVKTQDKNIKMMTFKDALLIIYKNERETEEYFSSGNWQPRPKKVPNYQVSVLNKLGPNILFYANGISNVLYQGYWAYEKIADMVPIDYNP